MPWRRGGVGREEQGTIGPGGWHPAHLWQDTVVSGVQILKLPLR